ncbi:MAG: hypothetical protein DRG35_05580 [Deltaproteobacteria bacterium]|nr:MAG: hypothetical protein DRG35_05580 [Deltaproteobacteria bacterium]RLG25708.1 MAG: hypothetical protein DRN76_02350 [Methanosarcinales archaeon]
MNGNGGNGGNNGDEKRKELRVILSGREVSRWIFLERLEFCFKFSSKTGTWQTVPYSKGLEICRRIISKAATNSDISVVGSMVEDLRKDEMVSQLFDKGRLVIGGVR